MKIKSIKAPKLLNHYLNDKAVEEFETNLETSTLFTIDTSDNIFTIISRNNYDLENILNIIKDKATIITLGLQYKYQYELDIEPTSHLFTVEFEDGYILTSELISVEKTNEDLFITFKII